MYLNDAAYWSGVPLNVWHYTIGGYQMVKKWLPTVSIVYWGATCM